METRPRILVVEPNRAYLGVLARRLTEAGYRVSVADTIAGAVAELHRAPVDLLLAELDMPRAGGLDLARLIRNEVAFQDLPLMFITAKSKPAAAIRAYEAGGDDVILKPFHFEVLCARIARRLDKARNLKRLLDDNAALDARIVERALEIGELREQLRAARAVA